MWRCDVGRRCENGGEQHERSVRLVETCVRLPVAQDAGSLIVGKQISYERYYGVEVITYVGVKF